MWRFRRHAEVGFGGVYRYQQCDQTSTFYTGTMFEYRQLTPMQMVLLVRRGVKASRQPLLGVMHETVHGFRKALQTNAQALQEALLDQEKRRKPMRCFGTRRKKGDEHFDLVDPAQTPSE